MKFFKILLASMLLLSLTHAKGDKKLLKPDKKTERPAWMNKDEFDVTAVDSENIYLLSTKKGFKFDKGKGKITILVVWKTDCKTCPKWLEDMQALQDAFPNKVQIIALEIGNTQKKQLEKLIKNKEGNQKDLLKLIIKNNKALKDFASKHKLSFPIIPAFASQENVAFALQTLYKFQFEKPRGKAKRGGGLPFTIVFGYQGQTAGITAGISEKAAYRAYIQKLIKHYDSKK